MSDERPFVSAWKALPLIGSLCEFQTFGGDTWVGKVVDARYSRDGIRVETQGENHLVNTRLDVKWRPAAASGGNPRA